MRYVFLVALAAFAANASAQQPIDSISVPSPGGTGSGADTDFRANPLSADGRYVAFSSPAALAPGDTNGKEDVYVRDRVAGTSILMSLASDGSLADSLSFMPGISGDGRFVSFIGYADNLVAGDTNGIPDVFLHDRDPDGNGIFDEGNATTIRINLTTTGQQADAASFETNVSGDGSTVVFESSARLTPDSDGRKNIFAYDVASGTLTCVSVTFDGNEQGGDSTTPSISDDGRYVAFASSSPRMVPGDKNGDIDVFVRDRLLGTTVLASVATNGTQGDDDSIQPAISADGRHVAFSSAAQRFLNPLTSGESNIYVRDLDEGTLSCITVLADGTEPNGQSYRPSLSSDGELVAFETSATSLVSLDDNHATDVLLFDRGAGTFETISSDCIGFTANADSTLAVITSDGLQVSFASDATNLNHDGLSGPNVFLRDRTIPWPTASHTNYGAGWPGTLGVPALTADVDPQYGATLHVDFGNSWGFWTVGFLLVGLTQDSLPTSKDGTLFVDILQTVPLAVGPNGAEVETTIPFDESLCGLEIDLQGIELDPGATRRVSFTPGLQLIVGR